MSVSLFLRLLKGFNSYTQSLLNSMIDEDIQFLLLYTIIFFPTNWLFSSLILRLSMYSCLVFEIFCCILDFPYWTNFKLSSSMAELYRCSSNNILSENKSGSLISNAIISLVLGSIYLTIAFSLFAK